MIADLKADIIGIILMGDMNIHHQKWLRFSNANTAEGYALKSICDDYAMKQLVDQPVSWHGPATVVAMDGVNKVWLRYRSSLRLVVLEQ